MEVAMERLASREGSAPFFKKHLYLSLPHSKISSSLFAELYVDYHPYIYIHVDGHAPLRELAPCAVTAGRIKLY